MQDGKIVEKNRYGVCYRESYETLSFKQQKDTGIKAIRRKEVIKGPYDLFRNIKKNHRIYKLLTEDLFFSYHTWNHVFCGDGGFRKSDSEWKRFKSEGEYMQEILPLGRIANVGGGFAKFWNAPLFENSKESIEYKLPSYDYDEIKESMLVYPLCVSGSHDYWRDSDESPIFIFGNKNKRFVEYVKAIQENPETRKMLELSGWFLDAPVKLKRERIPNEIGYLNKSVSRAHLLERGSQRYSKEMITKAISYLEKIASCERLTKTMLDGITKRSFYHANEEAIEFALRNGDLEKALELYQIRSKEVPFESVQGALLALRLGKEEIAKELYKRGLERELDLGFSGVDQVKEVLDNYDEIWKVELKENKEKIPFDWEGNVSLYNIELLNLLIKGKEIYHRRHTVLPIVRHPNIRKLRWCHADCAILERDGKTNVLFFESV